MGRWGGRDSDKAGARDVGEDDWSPEARKAAAEARKAHSGGQGTFHLSAVHPTGAGQRFKTKANSHEQVEHHMFNLRKTHPEHNMTVHHQESGTAHTFGPGKKYDRTKVGF